MRPLVLSWLTSACFILFKFPIVAVAMLLRVLSPQCILAFIYTCRAPTSIQNYRWTPATTSVSPLQPIGRSPRNQCRSYPGHQRNRVGDRKC
ncbi:hypothetical protein EJ02DRAFT_82904 [Clathrospora elynae]|uniref:Uncharacterized protein n=1 Tax=Clathrospora elynae TaxID=706981 RepID=A0A6A5S7C5_9PLEO|nr:hypothetical protein EJ02DRAFT_82904 [Clathrospora elynae]